MSNIKQRKQMLAVHLKDGTILHSDKSMQALETILNSDSSFVMVDGVLFNKFEFKKAQEFKADDITLFKMSLPQEEKAKIASREIKMQELWKKRDDVQQIQRYLESVK